MSKANDRQVGGGHYKTGGEEHWDRVWRLKLDYFQAQITKYVERCWKKNGIQDLEKARHVLDKYIELHASKVEDAISTEIGFQLSPGVVFSLPGQIAPSGWVGFTFEGADANGYLYSCRSCRASFHIPPDTNPHTWHAHLSAVEEEQIEGDATRSYVDQ